MCQVHSRFNVNIWLGKKVLWGGGKQQPVDGIFRSALEVRIHGRRNLTTTTTKCWKLRIIKRIQRDHIISKFLEKKVKSVNKILIVPFKKIETLFVNKFWTLCHLISNNIKLHHARCSGNRFQRGKLLCDAKYLFSQKCCSVQTGYNNSLHFKAIEKKTSLFHVFAS